MKTALRFAFSFDSRPYNAVFWNTNFKGLGGGASARAGEERFGAGAYTYTCRTKLVLARRRVKLS